MQYLHTLLAALAGLSAPRIATGNTIFVSEINKHQVYCAYVQREKGCYNMHKCEDGNTYYCVSNIEQRVDK